MEYIVKETDTLVRIAAFHDCTVGDLMKLNKLGSRMVFTGQKILVPSLDGSVHTDSASVDTTQSTSNSYRLVSKDEIYENVNDGIKKTPGGAVSLSTLSAPAAHNDECEQIMHAEEKVDTQDVDTDCLRKFIKIRVKQITKKSGTVSGTLLVTPNALMFDPDIDHALVVEYGQQIYLMMARMEDIISVKVLKMLKMNEIEESSEDSKVYASNKASADVMSCSHSPTTDQHKNELQNEAETSVSTVGNVHFDLNSCNKSSSHLEVFEEKQDEQLDANHIDMITADGMLLTNNSTSSDFQKATDGEEKTSRTSPTSITSEKLCNRFNSLPSTSNWSNEGKENRLRRSSGKGSDNSENSFSRLGRTLSFHASHIRGTVASSAGKMTQSAFSGTKSVAYGVASHTKSAAGSLQTGIQVSAKLAASHAKVAVDAMSSVPHGIVSMGNEILSEISEPASVPSKPESANVQRIALMQSLIVRTKLEREKLIHDESTVFSSASSSDNVPDFMKSTDELLDRRPDFAERHEHLRYMCVRIKRPLEQRSIDESIDPSDAGVFYEDGYWYAMPKNRVDSIFHFLLLWAPGDTEDLSSDDGAHNAGVHHIHSSVCEFLLLDSEADSRLVG